MAYRRSSKNKSFTTVYNEVAQHPEMSMEARGLLLFMSSLPEDWEFHKNWLQKQCPGWGRDKLGKILKELEEKGYLIRTPKRSEDGKKLAGWDWEVLAESALNPEVRQTRQSDKEVRKNNTEPDLRVSSQSGLQSDCSVATTKETYKQKKQSSQSTIAREEKKSAAISFPDRVMTQLLADNLPASKKRYAALKIQEFQDRFPESDSVADCWAYVIQAIQHQYSLTGS